MRSRTICGGYGVRSREFLKLVHGLAEGNKESGVDEFAQIIEELKVRKAAGPRSAVSPVQFAAQGMILMRDDLELAEGSCTREVTALSPSPSAIARSFRGIAGLLPENLQPLGGIPGLEPNHTSIVIWVRVAGRAVLLGADLEEVADRTDGWSGVLASLGRPRERASLFKIPHHGSCNGHHARVWQDLLTDKRVAVLTPFHNGRVHLPTGEDVQRICRSTQQTYCAGSVETRRSEGPDRDTARRLRRLRKEVVRVVRKTGHVRVRGDILRKPHEWTVETFGAADKIC